MSENFKKITTPICDFVDSYCKSNVSRLHMPGHKGKSLLGFEQRDITEIDGADSLYLANGIIKQSEENASYLFGSGKTIYSTEGSSQVICAMLYLACLTSSSKKPTIIATRNAHKAFIRASALLDFDVDWLYPEDETYSLCKCSISENEVEKAIKSAYNPVAVYITSPDYLGNTLDILGISEICHKNGVMLIVDNAHGAYLKFLSPSHHPIDLGADMCCDSAHKTLPALTGAAYLHISKSADKRLFDNARRAMEMFGSTSPSYLILQSLDSVNRYIAEDFTKKLNEYIKKINALKDDLRKAPLDIVDGGDELKLTINTRSMGYSGKEIGDILRQNSIECEYADPDYVVLMFTPENDDLDLERIKKVLLSIKHRRMALPPIPKFHKPKKAISIRQAMFEIGEKMPTEIAENKILVSLCVSCPPAVTSIVAGEIIEKEDIAILKYYGINEVTVIDNK